MSPAHPDAAGVDFRTLDPTAPEARQAMAAYFAELAARFPGGFDAGSQSSQDAALLSAPGGAFVVALTEAEAVACGGVQTRSQGSGPGAVAYAEIKRMWVHPRRRGAGLGRRLLGHLESIARDLGHQVVRLDTHDTLVEAIRMYRRAGYREVERYNDNPYARHFFEKQL